jgi:hypothetical protein
MRLSVPGLTIDHSVPKPFGHYSRLRVSAIIDGTAPDTGADLDLARIEITFGNV